MEEVLPELVHELEDGYKTVEYQKLTVYLVKAMQEQQEEMEALKARIAELEGAPTSAK